ncbi:hypothetical protein TVAG_188170 [Trichomonas vaginalis G3]|uniref:Uncharacterized protein n=1 Tax=Trichomonas vaginalis (strain ATCC PRA-98 / G3) TaxID=412133 RepID=A2DV39_TRIV3|nr:glucose repressible protein MAK10 family [Trichomonas vaginalis G3]EAY15766.1 hypothetical protein TVAG_188170 [Trichomonas vaginalis G3]KAI5486539.1 glucose repressible protein MAK10 family [Trichomonas vaginalis G3]|eukprot:XP_001327989.1 hypothetical protein [Trichomonas vaginalis G3]
MSPFMNWAELDLGLFKTCQDSMIYQDFLFTDGMNSESSMTSLEVNMPRIDNHLLTKGLFSVSDVLKSGAIVPNKDITMSQIREVCGKLFDLQTTRLQGHSILQTTMISIYTNKQFTIENELLNHIVSAFVVALRAIESISEKVLTNPNSYWAMTNKYVSKLREVNKVETLEFLTKYKAEHPEDSDLIDCALFEIDFADYIFNYPNEPVPKLPNYIKESSEIGIYPQLFFRDLSIHSPPSHVDILTHEKAIEIFQDFLKSLNEIHEIKECTTIEEIVDLTIDWSKKNQNCLNFLIILFIRRIVQSEGTIFNKHNISTFLTSDLSRYHVPKSIFSHKDYPNISKNMFIFLESFLKCASGPFAYAHAVLSKYIFNIWVQIGRSFISLEQLASATWKYPITGNKEYDGVIKTAMILWTTKISIKLTHFFVYTGFQVDVYNDNDHATMATILRTCAKDAAIIYERETVLKAVYTANEHRSGKSKKVDASRYIVVMPEIALWRAKASYFEACFNLSRWAYKKDIFVGVNKGKFFNFGKTYQERVMHPDQVFALEFPTESQFLEEFNFDNVSEDQLKNIAIAKFNEAKKFLSDAIILYGKTPDRLDFLRDIITSSSVLLGYKDGMHVKVIYKDLGLMSFALE